jgi:hypothetical protein
MSIQWTRVGSLEWKATAGDLRLSIARTRDNQKWLATFKPPSGPSHASYFDSVIEAKKSEFTTETAGTHFRRCW